MALYEDLAVGKLAKPNGAGAIKPVASQVTFSIAAGTTNVCNVTMTVKDAAGVAVDTSHLINVWLSDAATGLGLTGTSASGTVTAGASGVDFGASTAKKALTAQTTAAGVFVLAITDTAKTGFYVCAQVPGQGSPSVSRVLVTADYG